MSTLRIKIVYEDDIRMFKAKSDTQELLSKVILFVKEAHDIETFRLVFKDDEGDEITIVDDDDLKEALNNSNKKTTKLYVKTNQGKKDEEEKQNEEPLTTNVNEDENDLRLGETSEDFEETEDDDNNNNNFGGNNRCKWLKFLDDISEDKELKEEFINFITTFIVSLQNTEDEEENPGTLNNGSELFIQALSLHPKLNKHETMSKFVSEKLDSLFYQFPHLLNILKQINADDIPKFIDLIIDFNNNNKNSPKSNNFPMLPPFLFPFLGLFNCKYQSNNHRQGVAPPPFGLPPSFWGNMFGGFHRGHGYGRHRHHRGRHGHGHRHRHHGHGHHGYGHGRRFNNRGCGRRGGMRKQCGRGFFNQSFFEEMNNNNNNNFEKCKKHKDLRADIINENITLGKNAFVSGNQTLIKTWKMKNVGKKVIPPNCSIQYFGRKFNLMIDGTKFELKNKEIQLNEEFEVSVVVKSPNENGKYTSKWKLVTPDGSKFGQPLIVSFIVNDFNDNSNNNYNNSKEYKKLRKEEKKNYKKQQKFLRKEEKIVKKEEKLQNKKEKLRNRREKLLQKLQLLEEQSNKLNNNNQNNNNDDKDDKKEEIIEQNIQNNNSNNINLNEDEEEIIIIEDENENENTNENKITLEGDDDKFIYSIQLEQLKNMGFNDENQLKQLLEMNNGSIEAVLNSIM